MSSGEQRSSSESPLKDLLYRFLWVTMFASEIGVYMQPVGASWLITSLVPSPCVVALLQVVVTNSSLNFLAYNSVSSSVRTRVVSVRQLVYWGGCSHGQHDVGNCCGNLGNSNCIACCIYWISNRSCHFDTLQARTTQ